MIALQDEVTDHDRTGGVLHTRAEAEAYIASVCFKHGPPRLTGVELEWTVHHAEDSFRALDRDVLAAALGPHAPDTLCQDTPHVPLPRGGIVTLEPGGQVEISSSPRASLSSLINDVGADVATLTAMLADTGLELGSAGADPFRPPRRVLRTPRYAAMEAAFADIGPDGLAMMCSTAGVQVCLDAGEPGEVAQRWAALHELGPVLCAVFGNSPVMSGAVTPWVSARQRALFGTDPARMRPGPVTADPAASWARHALDASVICVRGPYAHWRPPRRMSFADWIVSCRPRPPTVDDLDYHLSTLFPPVRPRGYLEVRYLDAQRAGAWVEPVALLAALLSDRTVLARAREAVVPAYNRWLHAARYGLADARIAMAAREMVGVLDTALARTDLSPSMAGRIAEALEHRVTTAEVSTR